MNLPAIHTLWVGSALGPLERLCLASWVRQGHEVVLHAYDALAAPPGVRVADAGLLCPPEKIFRHRRTGSLALFSDYFRFLIMRAHPAIWLDADVYLVRSLEVASDMFLACESSGPPDGINMAAFRLLPDSPLLSALIRNFEKPWGVLLRQPIRKAWPALVSAARHGKLTPGDLAWGSFAYGFIQRHVCRHGFEGLNLGPETCLTPVKAPLFTPVPDADALLAPPVLYLHLYRSHQTAHLARPVPGSVYARLWELVGLSPDGA